MKTAAGAQSITKTVGELYDFGVAEISSGAQYLSNSATYAGVYVAAFLAGTVATSSAVSVVRSLKEEGMGSRIDEQLRNSDNWRMGAIGGIASVVLAHFSYFEPTDTKLLFNIIGQTTYGALAGAALYPTIRALSTHKSASDQLKRKMSHGALGGAFVTLGYNLLDKL